MAPMRNRKQEVDHGALLLHKYQIWPNCETAFLCLHMPDSTVPAPFAMAIARPHTG